MAKMLCKCGNTLGTSDCPSPYKLFIYYSNEVDEALKNRGIRLLDFLEGWDEENGCEHDYMKRSEPVEYWYCPECKRVYEVQCPIGGRWLRVYRKACNQGESLQEDYLNKIYVFTDVEVDAATEENAGVLLKDYLRFKGRCYFITNDDRKVGVSNENGRIKTVYELEEMWEPQ